jgi:ribosomal protein L37AE/L43A
MDAEENDRPPCPQCGSREHVRRVSCRCMSCPPWECMECEPYAGAGYKGYEFYDDDD